MHEKPNIDPIDRNNLLQLLQHHLHDLKPDGVYKKGCIRALGIVKSILKDKIQTPTLDHAPVRHGEWVPYGLDDQYEGSYLCSECKAENFFAFDEQHYHYCPNCGAKMDGGEDNA